MTDHIWTDIFKSIKNQDDTKLLKEIIIFQDLRRLDLIKISKLLHLRKYKKDEFIFKQKELGESMYIIKSGEIKISKRFQKQEKTLSTLTEGSFFGEVSLVDEDPRNANAVATKDTSLLGFFRADLMHLMDSNPRMASSILYRLGYVLGKRLTAVNDELEALQ